MTRLLLKPFSYRLQVTFGKSFIMKNRTLSKLMTKLHKPLQSTLYAQMVVPTATRVWHQADGH